MPEWDCGKSRQAISPCIPQARGLPCAPAHFSAGAGHPRLLPSAPLLLCQTAGFLSLFPLLPPRRRYNDICALTDTALQALSSRNLWRRIYIPSAPALLPRAVSSAQPPARYILSPNARLPPCKKSRLKDMAMSMPLKRLCNSYSIY